MTSQKECFLGNAALKSLNYHYIHMDWFKPTSIDSHSRFKQLHRHNHHATARCPKM